MNCQQDAVYAAEVGLDDGPTFGSLEHAQEFVDNLREQPWWEKWLSNVLRVEVGPARRGATFAGVGWFEAEKKTGRMEFSTSRPSLGLVVHELAHVIASAKRGSKSHDPWFARIYLELTYLIRGSVVYSELLMRFLSHHVDFDAGGITEWERTSR